MTNYKRIFAALDGSSTQEAVIRRALAVAHSNGADLLFGHVVDSVPYEANVIDYAELAEDGRQRIEESLKEYLAQGRQDENIASLSVEVRAGRVAETLLEALIAPYNPDLVICGVRGFSNIKYAFVGSVSTNLIRNLNCDVLVVRPENLDNSEA